MKIINLLALLLLMTSCSYYQAASHNKGDYTGVDIKGCSTNLFGIPLSPSDSRLDLIMSENQITHEDIYTVQNQTTLFLGELLFQNCTVVSLNESGAKKYSLNQPSSTSASSDKKKRKKKKKKDALFLFKNVYIEKLDDCNKVPKKNKAQCRKKYFDYMNQ